MDLTAAYDGVKSARRTVVHLLPGIAVVLDEGEFDESEEISLRWHTAVASTPNKQGAFEVKKDDVSLAVQVSVLEGELRDFRMRRHRYAAPFDKDRTGEFLEQRREPYVETRLKDRRYRVLSLFSLAEGASTSETWRQEHDGWSIGTNAGECHVQVDDRFLSVSDQSILKSLRVRL
ncbi:MAG: hypothetical protein ACKVGW_16710 [Verrucomicrobiia bacterium]